MGRGDDVHVSPVPEILRGQTFVWEVPRGKEKRAFLSLTLQTKVYAFEALPYLQPITFFQSPHIGKELRPAKAVWHKQFRVGGAKKHGDRRGCQGVLGISLPRRRILVVVPRNPRRQDSMQRHAFISMVAWMPY